MTEQEIAEKSVKRMLDHDAFSQWLGIELIEVKPKQVTIQMKVRKDMLNGFAVCHGGVTYAFADSALAFASNTHGQITVSIENSIAYPVPVHEGDILIACAKELSASNRVAIYEVIVTKKDGTKAGFFRGVVYRTQKDLLN